MRVMHIFSGRETGGIASVILPLLKELKGRGMDIMPVFLCEGPMAGKARGLGLAPVVISRRHCLDVMLIARLSALIRSERADIVHTHSVSGNFYGRLAAFFARRGVIITSVHADTYSELMDATGSARKAGVWHATDLFMARFSRVLIANSRATAEIMRQKGVSEYKLRVVCNGIDCSTAPARRAKALRKELGIGDGAGVVGSVGRLTGTKNYPLFLRAARSLLESEPDVFFLLVGDGPERSSLESLARRLGIEERVIITGWQEDVDRYIALMDVFALTSVKEGFGLVILEAMKQSKPVVCTAVGGVPEVVAHGKTGFLVPDGDEAELAVKLKILLVNQSLRRRLGRNGRKRLEEEFSLEKMADEITAIYSEAS